MNGALARAEFCRRAKYHLATTKQALQSDESGVSIGICSALDTAEAWNEVGSVTCEEVFDLLCIRRRDWLNSAYLLPPLSFGDHDQIKVQEAYTARVMLLELAAILYEEEEND